MKTILKLALVTGLAFLGTQSLPQLASASVIEGRLLAKLHGELDPVVLGDACVTWIEYFDTRSERFSVVGIWERRDDFENCLGSDIDLNEEIDFDFARMSRVRGQRFTQALRDLERHAGIQGRVTYFEYGHGIRD